MIRHLFISALLFICIQVGTYGQCCSAGNPSSFSFNDNNSLKAKSLLISSSFKYGFSDKYFKGSRPENVGFYAPANYSFLDLKIAFGINNRITLQAETGYFLLKQQKNPDPYPADKGYGLGDAAFNLRYRFYKSVKYQAELTAIAGMRLPVGVFDQEIDGVKLPISLQPSSGSFVYFGGLSLAKSLKESKLRFFGSAFAEFPQLIHSKNFYYKYGNLYNLSIAVAYPLHRLFMPALQLQGEMRGRASREQDQEVDATGYKVITISPQIESDFLKDWSILIYADLPVYRYFNGIQLANSYKAGIKLAKRFSI
ncbi:MAG: hypothetical protein IPH45_07035 [Bacteroidales bacterium]|nr:hypothetical protein [Bacteroidales bacterium]